jgi:nucleotide-binding universal stress UspA family protein
MKLRDGQRATTSSAVPGSAGRPVLLLTFDVPVTAEAAELAVDAAVESGQPLVVVNAVELPMRPMTSSWGTEVVVTEDVDASLRAPAELAHALAVEVERIRLVSPRPVAAVLELLAERRPGLVVLGCERRRGTRRRLARAQKQIVEAAPCLVWTGNDSELGRV